MSSKNVSLTPADFEGYEKAWEAVQKLENEGLPQSALEKVEEILVFAKQEKNSEQTIKAIIHKCKYTVQVQEDGNVKAIQIAEEELTSLPGESKPVLQSLLAEMYWNFYQQNRWQFMNRTQAVTFKNDDILTWDITTLFEKTRSLYVASLENAEALKQTPIVKYDDILVKGDEYARLMRPTVYDFIAHRALDFLMNDETYLNQPTYNFEVTDATVFADDKTFANHKFQSTDSVSRKLLALQILQELTNMHLQDPYATAITDVNLKRLQFAKENARLENKETLYIESLLAHDKKYERDSSSTRYLFEIANYHHSLASKYQPLVSDAYKLENKTAIEICNKAIQRAPESFGARNCAGLKTQIEYKSLQVTAEKVVVPGLPSRMLVSWKNVNTTYIKIVKLTEQDRANTYLINTTEKITYYSKLPAVKSWTQTLPDDGDHNQHNVEIKIPDLKVGSYVLMISETKDFALMNNGVAVAQFWVSNISYIENRIDDGNMEFYVLDRTSGEPLKGAQIQSYKKDYDYTTRKYNKNKSKTYKTDDKGYFKLDEYVGRDYQYISFKICCNGDTLDIDNDFYLNNPYRNNETSRLTTYFFTDRSIYRPGQTIYFKGIMVQQDESNKPVNLVMNRKTTVTFYDVNSQKVSEQQLISNDYGSFSGSFTAPTGLLNGEMLISNEYGNVYVSVEEYKRPKYYVEFEEVKGSFVLNDTITVIGNAIAYAGNNIDNAKVSYRVVRNASFPYWYDYFWWRPYPSSPQMEIAHGETVTNASGKFSIDFKAIPDASISKDQKPQFTYTVYADVIDLNGETRSGQASASVGYISQLIEVSVPQTISRDSIQKISIKTTNLNYAFEPAAGTITIHKLNSPDRLFRNRLWVQPDTYIISEEEYYKLFPHNVYKNENDERNWQLGKQTAQINFNTADTNIIELDPSKWEDGFYKLELQSTDKITGEEIKKEQYFFVRSATGKFVPEKYLYSPETYFTSAVGEAVNLKISSATDVHVLYVLHFRDKIIESRWIDLKEEQKTIPVTIKEEYRGGLQAEIIFIKDNQVHQQTWNINVPWTNKDLKVSFETYRNKLEPGSKETWKIKIEGNNGEKVAAEFLASMYDASLDAFKYHGWNFLSWPSYYNYKYWGASDAFGTAQNYGWFDTWNKYVNFSSFSYDYLNWFGLNFYQNNYYERGGDVMFMMDSAAPEMAEKEGAEEYANGKLKAADKLEEVQVSMAGNSSETVTQATNQLTDVIVRSNLNETAFFYPHLETDSTSAVIFSFTMPEALTKWSFMGIAHTKDLQSGMLNYPIITQKELMVVPNVPRFLREGDEIFLTAKVSSLTDSLLNGMASLEIFDAVTMLPLDAQFANLNKMIPISIPAKQSIPLSWKIKVPEGIQAIVYRVKAKAGSYADGEENALPVLSNRMLVTESLPLPIRWGQTKTFAFDKLINNNSSSLQHQNLTLEFTSNPAWYAIQSLPYMMEYPYECAEQVFNRYYSNSIAGHVANSSPKIKSVFDSWKNSSDALVSNLEKNQELKSLLLEETPWVLQAKDETERKKRIALLFDLNKMSNEKTTALNKLINMQTP
ncbi:MAG: alpha-2-macroglobulin family protein, partial [Chitinophagales bacterium]